MQTTIVVLDANEAVRRALGRVLQKKDFLVRTFSRTKQFLDYLNSVPVDIAVLDCDLIEPESLPARDRLTSQTKLRLVLTTASPARQQALKEAYPSLPVLLKPFGSQELLKFILEANELP